MYEISELEDDDLDDGSEDTSLISALRCILIHPGRNGRIRGEQQFLNFGCL